MVRADRCAELRELDAHGFGWTGASYRAGVISVIHQPWLATMEAHSAVVGHLADEVVEQFGSSVLATRR